MSFIGIKVPHETARLLSGLDVPGKREDIGSFHITMFYFGENLSIDRITEIIRVSFNVISSTKPKPFTVRTSRVSSFPKGDGAMPIICRVESDALHDLRNKIRLAYNKAGVEYINNHPEYKPHVTLAYSDEDNFEERRIPTVEWGAHELVFWAGDSGDDKLTAHFPLILGNLEKMAVKIAHRYWARTNSKGSCGASSRVNDRRKTPCCDSSRADSKPNRDFGITQDGPGQIRL